MAVSQSSLLGAAGEHYILCQLLRRGFIAALAPAGVPNADIIVSDDIGEKLCAVQVKTRRELGSDKGWHMKPKHEQLIADRLFYCFVDFGASLDFSPVTYVVPSKVVAEAIRDNHQLWLRTPGMKGQQRKDSPVRRMLPDYSRLVPGSKHGAGWLEQYKEAWKLI
jgi:hypothetical protein